MTSQATARLGETPFSVIDQETTGLYPGGYDRVVEVAIVRTDPRGAVIDEYATLVNPRRDVGPTPVNGITAEEVLQAPVFEEIVGDVVERLDAGPAEAARRPANGLSPQRLSQHKPGGTPLARSAGRGHRFAAISLATQLPTLCGLEHCGLGCA
jgi:hypothetical protein